MWSKTEKERKRLCLWSCKLSLGINFIYCPLANTHDAEMVKTRAQTTIKLEKKKMIFALRCAFKNSPECRCMFNVASFLRFQLQNFLHLWRSQYNTMIFHILHFALKEYFIHNENSIYHYLFTIYSPSWCSKNGPTCRGAQKEMFGSSFPFNESERGHMLSSSKKHYKICSYASHTIFNLLMSYDSFLWGTAFVEDWKWKSLFAENIPPHYSSTRITSITPNNSGGVFSE